MFLLEYPKHFLLKITLRWRCNFFGFTRAASSCAFLADAAFASASLYVLHLQPLFAVSLLHQHMLGILSRFLLLSLCIGFSLASSAAFWCLAFASASAWHPQPLFAFELLHRLQLYIFSCFLVFSFCIRLSFTPSAAFCFWAFASASALRLQLLSAV